MSQARNIVGMSGGVDSSVAALRLRDAGEPIAGLYAAGNCAGFPSGRAYWAGGATIGLALTFGWRAARHAASRVARRGDHE